MKDFFKGVRKHIDRLDAGHLREQYKLVADELASLDRIIDTLNRGIIVIDESGTVTRSNPAARKFLGVEPPEALSQLGIIPGKAIRREIEIAYPEKRILDLQTIPYEHGTIV